MKKIILEPLNRDMTVEAIRLALGLAKNSDNINRCKRIREKLQTPEKFLLNAGIATMQKVIKEYKCNYFAFIIKQCNARYANVAIISKDVFLRYCKYWLYPSTVQEGEQKRDEAGKPCFRFNAEAMRKDLVHFIKAKLDLEGYTWKSWEKYARTLGKRHNSGCYAEVKVCELFGWEQIGELDRQSHTIHCDGRDAEGNEYEIKLETGYITSQFWTSLHEWESDNDKNKEGK